MAAQKAGRRPSPSLRDPAENILYPSLLDPRAYFRNLVEAWPCGLTVAGEPASLSLRSARCLFTLARKSTDRVVPHTSLGGPRISWRECSRFAEPCYLLSEFPGAWFRRICSAFKAGCPEAAVRRVPSGKLRIVAPSGAPASKQTESSSLVSLWPSAPFLLISLLKGKVMCLWIHSSQKWEFASFISRKGWLNYRPGGR